MARRIDKKASDSSRAMTGASNVGKEVHLPSREEVLRYIEENPTTSGKRELARAFNLKGSDRIWLKDILSDLKADGTLQKAGKQHHVAGQLPPVTVLDIFSRDAEGSLIARLADRGDDEDTERPTLILIKMPKNGRAIAGMGDRVLAKIQPNTQQPGPAYTGRILKVFEKKRDSVLGVLREAKDGSFRIEPVERRQSELVIGRSDIGDARPGDLVTVEPLRSPRIGLQRGRILDVIGSMHTEKAVSMIAIHAHEIPYIFGNDVLEEAENAKPATMAGRDDWRTLSLVTIDPPDAKDHDDAVHAELDPDTEENPGGVIVTVAIADVAYYIRPGSALDKEALKRGNSVYFPDRVVPMLPERISNDLCSLREGEDRPAMAVRMRFAADGRKLSHQFHRITMRSAAKLSYQQAQAAIDGTPDEKTEPLLDTVLRPLWQAYAVLTRGRKHRDPLELDLPERKIVLKPDGTVDRVWVPPRLDAHKLIEEFMIQANVAAAETLEARKQTLIYRVHDEPSLAKQELLREFLLTIGMSLAQGANLRPTEFNSILKRVEGGEYQQLVNDVVLRTQSQAIYSVENFGHFGLSLKRYAHFTSPIRRYADLIIHRALISALGLGPDGLSREDEAHLSDIAALISSTERRAMAAERDTIDRLIADHLATRLGAEFTGRISGIAKPGLFVMLPEYGIDGFVPVSLLGDDYYIFDEIRHAFIGQRSGRGYQLGQTVNVRLAEIAPLAGALRFDMLTEPVPMPGASKSRHKTMRDVARKHKIRRVAGKGPAGKNRRR